MFGRFAAFSGETIRANSVRNPVRLLLVGVQRVAGVSKPWLWGAACAISRIVSMLGKGGMGEVYRADDLTLGQSVALKLLPDELAFDRKRLEYFYSEVRLSRRYNPRTCAACMTSPRRMDDAFCRWNTWTVRRDLYTQAGRRNCVGVKLRRKLSRVGCHRCSFGGLLQTSPENGPKSREVCSCATGQIAGGRCNPTRVSRSRNSHRS